MQSKGVMKNMSDLISRNKVIDILEKEKSLRCGYDADIVIFSIFALNTAYQFTSAYQITHSS